MLLLPISLLNRHCPKLQLAGVLESSSTFKWRCRVLYVVADRFGEGFVECGHLLLGPKETAKLFTVRRRRSRLHVWWASPANGSTPPSSEAAWSVLESVDKREKKSRRVTTTIWAERACRLGWLRGFMVVSCFRHGRLQHSFNSRDVFWRLEAKLTLWQRGEQPAVGKSFPVLRNPPLSLSCASLERLLFL